MKARVSFINNLNKSQMDELNKYIFKKGMEVYEEESRNLFRRFFKLLAVSLNKKYGFGKKRLTETLKELQTLSINRETDMIFWKHIDDIVINNIGLEFEREPYKDLDK